MKLPNGQTHVARKVDAFASHFAALCEIATPPKRPASDRQMPKEKPAAGEDVVVVQIDQSFDGYSSEEKLASLAALLGPDLELLFKLPASELGIEG